jgi:AAA+ ATPase superfamily predicted ATPase
MFYDRERELEKLNSVHSQPGSTFVVIYGRRRVGKTALAREFLRDKLGLYFFVGEKDEALLLEEFQEEIEKNLSGYLPSYLKLKFSTLEELFEFILDFSRERKIVVVFDEFQNVLRINPSMAFELQRFIDQNAEKPLLIVLSGSYLGMMKKLFASRKAPLYGRSSVFMGLRPLKPSHVFSMLRDMGIEDSERKVTFYSLFGGVPKYYELLELLGEDEPLELLTKAVEYSTFIVSEGEGLLMDEFGKGYRTYFSILRAIAGGKNRLVEIANALGVKPGSVSKYLEALQDYYGLIEREKPILGGRRSRYVISDPFMNAWFSLIEPQRKNIEAGDFKAFRRFLEGRLESLLGGAFERTLRDILHELNGKFLTFDELGPQWGRNYEIDLVAINREKKEATFIEAKWSRAVDGPREIGKLIAKSQLVPWKGERRYLLMAKGFRRKCDDCITLDELLSHLNP